jgi:hypothetical protein
MHWARLAPAAALVLLAACTTTGGPVSLSYDGNQTGSHQASRSCDANGTLVGSGKVESGQVEIRAKDGSDNELFRHTYDGTFDFSGQTLNGASGTWTIEATRSGSGVLSGGFQGHYTFTLTC